MSITVITMQHAVSAHSGSSVNLFYMYFIVTPTPPNMNRITSMNIINKLILLVFDYDIHDTKLN